jgi:spore coat protein A
LERLGFGEGQVEPADELDPVGNIMQFMGTGKAGTEASVTGGTDLDLADKFVDLRTDANNDDIADRAQVFSDTGAVLDSHVRKLGLFEGTDEFDRVTPKLGKAEEGKVIQVNEHGEIISGVFGPLSFHDETTEKPVLGSYEQWDIFNFTADSHPIHLHLTQYQVLEKREITFTDVAEDGIPDDITGDGEIKYGEDIFMGEAIALRPEEMGWQDTVHVDPGTMMSVVSLFDKPGDYVWHCHILSHEDNEMMRPFTVISDPDAIL